MKQLHIPRHIRDQTANKLLEAANTRPATGGVAAQQERPPTDVNVAPVNSQDRVVNLAAGVNQLIAPSNEKRRYLMIVNQGANAIRVSIGQEATAGTGLVLPANGFWEPIVPPKGAINALSVAGSTLLIIAD